MRAFALFVVAWVLTSTLSPVVAIARWIIKRDSGVFYTAAVGFDQAGGSVLYGQEDWTISSWTHRLCAEDGRLCWLEKAIDMIFWAGHCRKSYETEMMEMEEWADDHNC